MFVEDTDGIGVDVDVLVPVDVPVEVLLEVPVDVLVGKTTPELSCPRLMLTPHAACVSTLITNVHPDGLIHPDDTE